MYEVVNIEKDAGESESTRKELEKLIHTINHSTFDLAELLHKVKREKYYKHYGFNTFLEYVSELDMKTRKAQYLVRIVDILEQVGISREDYQPVGIAKLREITSLDIVDTDGDPALYDSEDGTSVLMSEVVKGLVAKAPTMSLEEIKDYVRVLKGLTGDNSLHWVNICVTQQALVETIQPALDLSKKNLGTAKTDEEGNSYDYSEGKALEMICVEYLNDPANSYIGGENG